MNTDICSILTFKEILASGYIGKRQSLILSIFSENYPAKFTASEVVTKLGQGTSEITRNRITELTKMGLLRKVGKVKCKYTNRLVNQYQWTRRIEPLETPKLKKCPTCSGKGKVQK